MSSAASWAMFVIGVLAFVVAWALLLWAEARVREATKMYARSQSSLDGALSKHIQADAMLRKSLEILKWAERYEFGAAMRTADARRKEEAKQ